MKITIDTKEDSHAEIRRVIQFLSHLVDNADIKSTANVFDQPSPDVPNVMGLFDTPAQPKQEISERKPEQFHSIQMY